MKYYIVGYMYSGKSTFGRRLAEERGMEFVDLDRLFEERFHYTVPRFFTSIEGMGTVAAQSLAAAAKKGKFLSKEELRERGKVSSTVVDKMSELGLLNGMPESSQLSIFDLIS